VILLLLLLYIIIFNRWLVRCERDTKTLG